MGFVGFEINSIVRQENARSNHTDQRPFRSAPAIFFGFLTLSAALFLVFGPPISVLNVFQQEEAPDSENTLASAETAIEEITPIQEPPVEHTSPAEDAAPPPPAAAPAEAPVIEEGTTVYEVQPGDNLGKIWRLHGAPQYGGTLAAKAWEDVGVSLKSLRPGDKLELLIKDGDIRQISRVLANGNRVVLEGDSKSGYHAIINEARFNEVRKTVHGVITSSFVAAALKEDVPYAVIDEVIDLLGNRVEFRKDLQPGDSFSITYIQKKCADTGADHGVQSIVSSSLFSSGSLHAAIRHVGSDGKERYYDETGNVIGSYFLRYPLQYSRISSAFNESRFHPVLQRIRPHYGVDFAAPIGTPVRAVGDGIVRVAGFRGGSGNMISLNHGERFTTSYLHLSKIYVAPGSRVQRGQVIGTVGMTGLATGPHLHFSLYDRGRYIDPLSAPLPMLSPGGEKIPRTVLVAELESIKLAHQSQVLASLVEKFQG